MLSFGYKTVQVLVLSSTLRLFSRSVCLWDNEVEWGIYLIEDYGSTSFHQLKVNGNSSQIGLIIGQEPPSCKIVLMLRTRQIPFRPCPSTAGSAAHRAGAWGKTSPASRCSPFPPTLTGSMWDRNLIEKQIPTPRTWLSCGPELIISNGRNRNPGDSCDTQICIPSGVRKHTRTERLFIVFSVGPLSNACA